MTPLKSAIACISAIMLMATAPSVPGKGHLSFESSFLDLGTLKKGDLKHYTFNFTNSGERKVKINSVVTEAECLHVSLKDSLVEPAAESAIYVVFDTEARKTGNFTFGVNVNSTADNKEVKLKLFGTLVE
jgi:hypothetical protein